MAQVFSEKFSPMNPAMENISSDFSARPLRVMLRSGRMQDEQSMTPSGMIGLSAVGRSFFSEWKKCSSCVHMSFAPLRVGANVMVTATRAVIHMM